MLPESFLRRYYMLGLELLEREVDASFPILGSINSVTAETFISTVLELNEPDRVPFAKSVAVAFREKEFSELGLTAEAADIGVRRLFVARQLQRATETQSPSISIPSGDFRKALRDRLDYLLGGNVQKWGGNVVRYSTNREGIILKTFVDFGSRLGFCYDHVVEDANGVSLIEGASVFSWWGLASRTRWGDISPENFDHFISSLESCIGLFLKHLPQLLRNEK